MGVMEQNVYFQLGETIKGFGDFLDNNTQNVKSGIHAVASIMPQTQHLADSLIYLMENLRNTIATIDSGSILHLDELSTFGAKVNMILQSAKELLPNEPNAIEDVKRTTHVLSDLPTLGGIKEEIVGSLDGIIGHLHELKS
jgi:hypothetical protein